MPYFRTIYRFRSERMKRQMEKIFAAVLELLAAERIHPRSKPMPTGEDTWTCAAGLLRGLPKVRLEFGWLSLAHNMLKKATIDAIIRGAVRKQSVWLPDRLRILPKIHMILALGLSRRCFIKILLGQPLSKFRRTRATSSGADPPGTRARDLVPSPAPACATRPCTLRRRT